MFETHQSNPPPPTRFVLLPLCFIIIIFFFFSFTCFSSVLLLSLLCPTFLIPFSPPSLPFTSISYSIVLCGVLTLLHTCTADTMLFAYFRHQLVHLILTQYLVGVLPSRPGISLGGAPATDADTPITLDLVSTLTRKLSLRSSQKELEQKHIVLTESEEVRGKLLVVYPYCDCQCRFRPHCTPPLSRSRAAVIQHCTLRVLSVILWYFGRRRSRVYLKPNRI